MSSSNACNQSSLVTKVYTHPAEVFSNDSCSIYKVNGSSNANSSTLASKVHWDNCSNYSSTGVLAVLTLEDATGSLIYWSNYVLILDPAMVISASDAAALAETQKTAFCTSGQLSQGINATE